MKLWECVYKVIDRSGKPIFYCKDWLWSTSNPSGKKSVGHYWRHSFEYSIVEYSVKDVSDDIDLDCSRARIGDTLESVLNR